MNRQRKGTYDVRKTNQSTSIGGCNQSNSNQSNDNINIYCTICKMKKTRDHDCSIYNKEFSTCLIPNCNILFRSLRDFTPHYQKHNGMPAGVRICNLCYKENKESERDNIGQHINCKIVKLFKCYSCNIVFKCMTEFANHKLKTHNNARLLNSEANYVCFYCEKSSKDLMMLDEHIKSCRDNQYKSALQSQTIHVVKLTESQKKGNVTNINEKLFLRTSKLSLFTCLKSSCNLLFQNFPYIKDHHCQHFEIRDQKMCWQCFKPFENYNSLRKHQYEGNCHTPEIFKCYECPEQYEDMQSLSIHKCIAHNAKLMFRKRIKNISPCPICKIYININDLRNHFIQCQCYNTRKIHRSMLVKQKRWCTAKCRFCPKACLTEEALEIHMKLHKPGSSKRGI